ncbi:gp53-like domain-containing protein [Escherichia coli]
MHRIDTKTAQKDKFGAGKNGFTRGNPQTGTPATDLDDDYFDMLQEELCSVVEASGASLEKGRHDQLLTALRALLLSRKNPFGDIKSDGTVKIALENLGLRASGQYTDNLLFTGPDGLKIQVFRRTLANLTTVGVVNSVPVTFPVPFPVNCWGVFSTKLTWVQITNSCEWVNNTGFTAQVMMNIAVNTNTSDAMFLAIGY